MLRQQIDVDFDVKAINDVPNLVFNIRNCSGKHIVISREMLVDATGGERVLAESRSSKGRINVWDRDESFSGQKLPFRLYVDYFSSSGSPCHLIKDCYLAWCKNEMSFVVVGSKYRANESEALGYLDEGKTELAINLLLSALVEAEEEENPLALDNILGQLGYAYLKTGDYTKAIFYSRSTLEVQEQFIDNSRKVKWLLNLGWAELGVSQTTIAVSAFEKALEIAERITDMHSIGIAMSGLGNCRFVGRKWTDAIPLLKQAASYARTIDDRLGLSRRLGTLGQAFANVGQYDEAVDVLAEGISVAGQLGDITYITPWATVLLSSCERTEKLNVMIDVFEELEKCQKVKEHERLMLCVLWQLGMAYSWAKNQDKALMNFNRAIILSRELNDDVAEMLLLYNTGKEEMIKKNWPEAISVLRSSMQKAIELQRLDIMSACLNGIEKAAGMSEKTGDIAFCREQYARVLIEKWFPGKGQ
jgi:tetratricopeptide (TPR) repeat protein